MDKHHQILTKYWGYNSFRPLQEDIINSISEGKDTLGLLPTGGGKSLTFQIPALAHDGICVVVTPLIALMKDQVENLLKRNISAVAIYTGLTRHEIDIELDNCVHGKYKFLYLSPERLGTELFRERVARMNVSLIAVDEAHCISQWGYDFRPSYLKIAEIRDLLDNVPILALTATATPAVVDDIQEKLSFKAKNVFKKSFERKNINYVVRDVEDKQKYLIKIVSKVKGCGVVYVRNRKKTRGISELLIKNGFSADYYHAGLSNKIRDYKQDNWKSGKTNIIVSTNAFGMGIDKANVRFVVHMDLPDSIEAYFQEAGRGGRDEKKAYAVLLYNKSDKKSLEKRVVTNFPEIKEIKEVYNLLGSYLRIPFGEGKGMSYDFNIIDFSKTNKLQALKVFSSLKILQKEGYVEFTEEINNPSKIYFIVDRDELYRFQVANADLDGFIKLLLRSYTGVFTEYISINEEFLAKKTNSTVEIIYEYLKALSRSRIIKFIPRKKIPQVFYTEERLDNKSINISVENYKTRKARFEERISAILNYASSDNKCRSQILLSYFGEKDPYRCGQCDVCQRRNELDLSRYEFDLALDEIKALVKSGSYDINELMDKISVKEDKMLKVIQWLFDNNKIYKDQNEIIHWDS